MKKIVFFEGKKIVDISKMELPTGYGNRISHNAKVYILEDGTFVKASETIGKQFKYVCDECGCEKLSTTKPEQGNETYICSSCRSKNHNGMSGKHHSEEYKKIKSEMMKGRYDGENNPMYGKSWKDYTSVEIINEHNKKLSISSSGENNPMYGKNIKDYMSPEKYELWRKHVKDNGYNSKTEDEKKELSQKMSDGQHRLKESNPEYYKYIKSLGGKAVMSKKISYKMNSTESIVDKWLTENNVDHEYSAIIGRGDSCYQYDFILHGKRILIEVQGDYWHGNPNMFNDEGSNGKRKLNDIQKGNMKKDIEKLNFAEEHNFKVVYIWEEEINNGDFSKIEKVI